MDLTGSEKSFMPQDKQKTCPYRQARAERSEMEAALVIQALIILLLVQKSLRS
jgi:hypothetical protein